MDLKGKRILFISVQSFGIEKQIASELKNQGAIVDYYDERPANSFLVKALIRFNRNFISYYIDRYHRNIINKTKEYHYDYIFFIKGEAFSEKNLKLLFSLHPESKTIIYHWDSISNNSNAKKLLNLFDKKFSFDRYDCANFQMEFLPLFYYNEYSEIIKPKRETIYDLLFIGTAHSDRYKLASKVEKQIQEYGGRCFTFYYFQGKIMFYKYKFTHKEMKQFPNELVNFKPLDKNTILELYSKSSIILDIHHPNQAGLTLRTFEALGAKKKLITTNEDIKNYDFYNPNNILVIDRNNPIVSADFIKKTFEDIDEKIYRKYSISNWIKNIFLTN